MISDEYTREYDERQQINIIERAAHRFGCSTDHKRHFDGCVTIRIYMPNGKLFHEFTEIEKAVEWAKRWN